MFNTKPLTLLTTVTLFLQLIISPPTHASPGNIIINEIAAYEPSDTEWIEIYNRGEISIDLTGWKFFEENTNHSLSLFQGANLILEPKNYAIIANKADKLTAKYSTLTGSTLIIDSSWITLKESGEKIGLKNSNGDLVENFTYISAGATSLERINPLLDDYTSINWLPHPDSNSIRTQNFNYKLSENPQLPPDDPIDTTAPEDATTFTAEIGDKLLILNWTASPNTTNDLVNYFLYINESEKIIIPANFTTYTLNNLENNVNYSLRLAAVDGKGNENIGIEITATPKAPTIPETPPSATNFQTNDIVINEFVSAPISGYEEWLELYNNTDTEINLEGWKIIDGAGATTNLIGKIGAKNFFTWENPTGSLNNSGDLIILKSPDDKIINQVVYGDFDDGNLEDNIKTATAPNSLARNIDGIDTGNNLNDFALTITPTKNLPNTITPPQNSIPSNPSSPAPANTQIPTPLFSPRDVVINEIVSDPTDNETEFVEIYNNTNKEIPLNNWTLEDGGGTTTSLTGTLGGNGAGRFFVINSPKGQLNNAGDKLILKYSGAEIDSLTYGNWDDGNIKNNAPTATDPYSLSRITDGADTNTNNKDWKITATITKGAPNIITTPTTSATTTETKQAPTNQSDCSGIIINELLPNPIGDDSEGEFIELFNPTDKSISLANCSLGDNSKTRFKFEAKTKIDPQTYLTIWRGDSKISLNNSGEEKVTLYSSDGATVDSKNYNGAAPENQSWVRNENNEFYWSKTVTPNKKNIINSDALLPQINLIYPENIAPNQEITFDASDSFDPQGDEITNYHWLIQNSSQTILLDQNTTTPEIVFTFPSLGEYSLILKITTSAPTENEQKFNLKISPPVADEYSLIISEIFPNPIGADDNEWIELQNISQNPISLSGLKLDDEEGGSRPFVLPEITLAPQEFIVFKRSETKLVLNNTEDSVRILDKDNNALINFAFETPAEGLALAINTNLNWQLTSTPTPNVNNIFTSPATITKTKKTKKKSPKKTTLEELKNFETGDYVQVAGKVAVEPGVLGEQIMYITGSPGVQVYFSKKDWPELKSGDVINVTGEISESGGEKRLKIASAADIEKTNETAPIEPIALTEPELDEEVEGDLISVTGKIIELRGQGFYLDNGSSEIYVYIKTSTNISTATLSLKQEVKVTGIVSQTKSGYRLLPRYQTDIEVITPTTNDEKQKQAEHPTTQYWQYVILAIIAIISIVYWWKKRYATQ